MLPEHIDFAVFGYWGLIAVVACVLTWVACKNDPPWAG